MANVPRCQCGFCEFESRLPHQLKGKHMDLKKEILYEATFPSGDKCMVMLAEIKDYPSTGMPSDYFFQCLSPEFDLLRTSTIEGGFPIPEGILDQIKFIEVNDSMMISLFKPTEPFEVRFKKTLFNV